MSAIKPKNMNTLAHKIAMNEGGKVNLPIAQIKEVLRITAMIVDQDYTYRRKFYQYGTRVTKQERKKWSKPRG